MITAALMGSAYANTDCTATPGATQTSLPEWVYGTYADTGEASGGSVEVFEVSAPEGYWCLKHVRGGYTKTGDATGNTVTMTGGWVYFSLDGGYVDDFGDATGNTVTMSGGEVYYHVSGGYTNSGNATGNATENAVTINDGHVHNDVYGGYVDDSGDATGNTVDMTGGVVSESVYGGHTNSGDATGNTVTMTGGEVYFGDVYGGRTYSGDATVNTVNITGGQVGDEVYGGYSRSGNASDNTVTIAGGKVALSVYGGDAWVGNATDNTVIMTGGVVSNSVYGGYVDDSGDACGNTVTIADSTVGGEEVLSCIYGGYTEEGDANDNTVTVTGGQAEAILGGEGNNANGNTVTVTDATIGYEVCGGTSVNSKGFYSGTATGNTVTMNGGQVETICAARGYSTIGNTVVMNGGLAGSILAGTSYGGENSGNTVIVTEGVVLGGIGGGYLYGDGELRDNRVYLVGKGATATIGGKQYTGGAGGIQAGAIVAAMADEEAYHYVSSGNSIDVYGTGTTAGMVGYMEALTFHLGDGLASAGTPMLTITDDGLNLVYPKLGFRGDDVTDWSKFEGRSITLVQAADNVTGVVDGTEVDIINEVGGTLASATLSLGSGNALVLTFSGELPGGQTSYTANPGSPQTSAPDTIYGAYAETGDVTGGSAAVFEVATGGYESLGDVYGGYAESGNVSGCTANMDSGSAEGVYGGRTESGDVSGNTVNMTGGKVGSDVYGGSATGNATGNTVTMTGGEVHWDVVGGSATGNATDNSVNISGGVVELSVYGGSAGGNASGNTVTMNGGEVGIVYGGSAGGNASGNTVTMNGGEVALDVIGGRTMGNVIGNTVTMAGGEVHGDVIGGESGSGDATDNTVRLVGEGASYTIGDTTYQGSKVVIGGSVYAGKVYGGSSLGNTVHIHGTGIGIGGTIDDSQQLTFHLVQGQAGAPGTPMVTLGGALDLEGLELGFYGDAVTNWAAFKGKSITLVQAADNVTGVAAGTEVDITDEVGETLATATLTLKNGKALVLTFPGDGPVPPPVPGEGPDALDVALVNSLWASSAYVREFVRLSEAQGYSLKDGDTAVWGGGFGTFMHATGGKGFKSDGVGYGIGVNHAFSANTYAGISLGQGFGSYHNSGADGATVHQRAILAAATASTRITKDFSLGGHLAFGSVRNRADCRLDGASERTRWNDTVFNLGARLAYDFHVTNTTAITPFLGMDWACGAQDTIDGAYGRQYQHGRLNELRMPVGVTVSTGAEVGSTKLLPQLSVAYVPALAQQLPHADVSGNGEGYRVKGYAPGRNAFMLNAGINAVFSDSWSAGAFYTLETRRHSVDQSVNASVRYTF